MPSGGAQRSTPRQATAGALAAAVAVAFDWALHRAIAEVPFAPFALADRIVRSTPGSIATWMIDHLHHAAKALVAGGGILALVAAGVLVAAAFGGRARLAAVGFGVLALVSGALEPVQASLWGATVGAAVTGLGYGVALAALTALSLDGRSPWRRPLDLERRRGLTRVGELILAGAALNVLAPLVGGDESERLLDFVRSPRPRRPPFPRIPGLTPEVTSVGDHYIVDIDIDKPIIDPGSWRLRVGGLVERPLTLDFDELQRRFDVVSEYAVLTCISNPVGGGLAGNSLWEGVRLRDLLDATGASPRAWGIVVECADGYSAGIPLAAARHEASLVAIAQDGQPLTREHGFPCRLRVPALYGMLNPKWVTDVRVVSSPFVGYWAQQGWSPSAVVRTEARIDTPDRARAGAPVWIAGIAWAGVRGVSRVEVSTDGGRSWQSARLRQPLSRWAWSQWGELWTPPSAGRYQLIARATDGLGQLQDPRPRPPHPSGASGYPTRMVEVT